MRNAYVKYARPENEPVRPHVPGDSDYEKVQTQLKKFLSTEIEIPLIIGGKEVKTGNMGKCVCPHDHQHVLAQYHKASKKEVEMAIEASQEAWKEWSQLDWQARAAIFLKAADLLTKPFRPTIVAATMLNQSKTVHQAEIEAACELSDFLRFNVFYLTQLFSNQPQSVDTIWNFVDYRPLEGYIFAVTPFNFTAIAGNLPTSPALMGNVSLWKPASSAVFSAYYFMKILKEAGIPDGVINFLPGTGGEVGLPALMNPNFAGLHFTGSTATFQNMWKIIGNNIASYKTYPRIVGETGGKDFVVVHESADSDEVATALVRGSFEYQGQKCSAVSRAYVPDSLWPVIEEKIKTMTATIKLGDVTDCKNFMGAVIDAKAFESITGYIDYAKESSDYELIIGGDYDDSKGYFIQPTVFLSKKPDSRLMQEEIFGPVLTVYVYPANEYEHTLKLCDETSPYGLTGAVFAKERYAIQKAYWALRHSAGNFYINDKPTGAIVDQQPFGGSRASGTNDKAGSIMNQLRWCSVRSVKEAFLTAKDYRYPFMCDAE